MYNYEISRSFPWIGKITEKTSSVMKTFGVDMLRLKERAVLHECRLSLGSGDVCFITGQSELGDRGLL